MSNLSAPRMGGVGRLEQNIATNMTGHRSKKWCWPVFRFCLDLCANNAFHIYRRQKENPRQRPLGLLGFRNSIVDMYYKSYRKTTQIAMFAGSRQKSKVSDEVRFDKLSHWIGKAEQRRRAECGKTIYLNECNVMWLYTHNVLRDSMNSDRLTEWLAKKNTSSCNGTL